MKHITIGTVLLALSISLCGCASMTDCMISHEMKLRNQVLSQKAWGHWSWCYDELEFPVHFAKGFKAGYRNVLDGGNGCQPTLPPKCYWKPQFQTPKGRCQTHAWFDGFSHGALAAKQDGYGDLGQIPISPTARANIEMARRRPAQNVFDNKGRAENLIPANQFGNALVPPTSPGDGGAGVSLPGESGPPVPVRPYDE